jgi:aspartokinase-like uncharacterized kinase
MNDIFVIKVGGSLYRLGDLAQRLTDWLAEARAQFGPRLILVPGGGLTADLVREWDARHGLGEEKSHWLALSACSLNALFLAALLPRAAVVGDERDLEPVWARGDLPILDARAFIEADERRRPDESLPHTWDATSDSVAARLALVSRASKLILLKAADFSKEPTWSEAADQGAVDPVFPRLVEAAPFEVILVNLQTWR